MDTHSFCKTLARSICKEAKVRITYLYASSKNPNDSHWTIHGDSEMKGFVHTCRACCKYSAIFHTVSEYLKSQNSS